MSMSLFGSLMGNMEDDPFFGSAMRQMQTMDHMMNSMFQDGFPMRNMFRDFGAPRAAMPHPMMSPFGMMSNFNRLMSGAIDPMAGPMGGCNYSSSSTVISMTSGPDGPQVYKETSSTKVGPGGVKETQRTVTDSVTGTKKMAIGHHIGERAHIIEKEQNMHTGDREERQDFINLDEDEADDFNREWRCKTRAVSEVPRITAGPSRSRHPYSAYPALPAITAGPSQSKKEKSSMSKVSSRRNIHSADSSLTSAQGSSSSHRSPYTVPGQEKPKKSKNVKTVCRSSQEK